jgi:hypothetical protein
LGIRKKTVSSKTLSLKSVLKLGAALINILLEKLSNLDSQNEKDFNFFISYITQENYKIHDLKNILLGLNDFIKLYLKNQAIANIDSKPVENLIEILSYKSFWFKNIIAIFHDERTLILTSHFEIRMLLEATNYIEPNNCLTRTIKFLEQQLEKEESLIESKNFLEAHVQSKSIDKSENQKSYDNIKKNIDFLMKLLAHIEVDYIANKIKETKEGKIEIIREYGLEFFNAYCEELKKMTNRPFSIIQYIFTYFDKETPFKRVMNYIAKINQMDYKNIELSEESGKLSYSGDLYTTKYMLDQLEKISQQDVDDIKRNLQRYLSGEVMISDQKLRELIKAITENQDLSPYYLAAKLALKVGWLQKSLKENGNSDEAIKLIFNQYCKIYQTVIQEYPILINIA